MDNSSIFHADRTTHLKVVVLALMASIVVVVVGIAARTNFPENTARIQTAGPALKAGKPLTITQGGTSTVR